MVEFTASLIYAIITIFALIGTILYVHAYIKMKRTRIIGSVALLLFMIFIDSAWWFFCEFNRMKTGQYSLWMVSPCSLIIIKSFLAIGVLYFVITSVKSDDKFFHM